MTTIAATCLNSIASLKQIPFRQRSNEDKLATKELGAPTPNLNIKQVSVKRGKTFNRGFSRSWYERKPWLAGCEEANALFCFPCVLIHPDGSDPTWTTTGFTNMSHLSERTKKHECSMEHMDSCLKLSAFGRVNIVTQLDESYRTNVRSHNDEVRNKRQILSRLIDCVKFCRVFKSASRDKDQTGVGGEPGGSRGAVDLEARLDEVFEERLKNATALFEDASKTVQNELLDCMLSVIREGILAEVRSANFVAVQAEVTHVCAQTQLVLVLRYVDQKHDVQERFFEFIPIAAATSSLIASVILERLHVLFPDENKSKLIAQAYDGASVVRGERAGVQQKVRQLYSNAHYVHCYAHHLNWIMQQATSHIPKVRIFFSDLGGISSFFTQSPKCLGVFDQIVAQRLPSASTTRWNFDSRIVSTVKENLDDLKQCFQSIRTDTSFDSVTVREASGFLRMLQDDDFLFFMQLFHQIMPHVDMMSEKLQRKNVDAACIKRGLQSFANGVQAIRDQSSSQEQQEAATGAKRSRMTTGEEKQRLTMEVCDTILAHAKERFFFTDYLASAALLQGDMFADYCRSFPVEALNTTVEAYPMLNKAKLKNELCVIYETPIFKGCNCALALYRVLMRYDLQETFSETVTLLNILITTPMITAEAERCFSTLKRVKTFLKNAKAQEHLNVLAMLSVERELVRNMPDFNERVIDRFAALKESRAEFRYE